jgi:hypothetical protein
MCRVKVNEFMILYGDGSSAVGMCQVKANAFMFLFGKYMMAPVLLECVE